MTLRMMDWFCGAGGSSQGGHAVPGVEVTLAANHWDLALQTHAANFAETDHWQGDIREAPVAEWPVADLFWASPECPQWSSARGKPRDYHTQDTLPGLEPERDEAADRSRALMEEVPMYLAGVQRRGGLVLGGVVENVVEVRSWVHWDRWLSEFRTLGYDTRLIALNSMHAHGTITPQAPQSRDRLYLAYWHESIGRSPDWDKWMRPFADCERCGRVSAVQSWKRHGADMGRYRASYTYRCPSTSCRGQTVEPHTLPALAAIDLSIPAQRIGDRERPLADATMDRIRAGAEKHWLPLLVPAGGTWRDDAISLNEPMPARTTRESDGVALPPLMVPVEGRDGKTASPATVPYRTQTARNETGVALPPVMVTMRGGGSLTAAHCADEPMGTVSAGGNHHGLVQLPPLLMRNNNPRGGVGAMCTPLAEPARTMTASVVPSLLVPYYGNGTAAPATGPVGALSTRDRYALASPALDLDEVRFRMLTPDEIGRAMAFTEGYRVLGNKRQRVRQYGNAVTPPVAELIVSALTECVTGEDLERREWTEAA